LKEEIAFKKEELAELHGKEAALKELDEIQLSAETLAAETAASHAETRVAWAKESKLHAESVTERNAAVAKARQKDEEEYQYNLTNERKQESNEWNNKLYARQTGESRRLEEFNHTNQLREADLSKREEEMNLREEAIASKEEALKSEVKSAVGKAEGILSSRLKSEAAMAQKDFDAQASLQNLRIDQLIADSRKSSVTITQLNEQLESARGEVNTMAQQALVAAGGAKALSALQESDKSPRGR